METRSLVKTLALLNAGALICSVCWEFVFLTIGPPEEYTTAKSALAGIEFISDAALPYFTGVVLLTLSAHLISLFLIFKLKNFGRKLFMYATIIFLVLALFSGYYVQEPIADVLVSISEMLAGALIVVIYFTDAKKLFA